MKICEMRVRQVVRDKWFIDWGVGTVDKVKKTVAHILFTGRLRVYDAAHCQFLEKVKK